MEFIKEVCIKNKKVLLRVDYNVPLSQDGTIVDNNRIIRSLETIKFLLSTNNQIILLSHMGRVNKESDIKKYSLKVVATELEKLLGKEIFFVGDKEFDKVSKVLSENSAEIIMLENTRMYDINDRMESSCSESLSKFYASLADIYVNDAFGASHRRHASTYGIRKYIPSYYGFLIKKELDSLKPLINVTKRPFVVFMGGAKVEDKLLIIKDLLIKCDYLCLGGGILNSFLKANKYDVKDSLATNNDDTLSEINDILNQYRNKIIMTTDLIWLENKIMDINIKDYKSYIEKSKLLFINGTPGKYENEKCSSGTIDLLASAINSKADVIIGGGDTAAAISKFSKEEEFNFISTGGGASLMYIASGCLDALGNL